jgi:hypothetical protein
MLHATLTAAALLALAGTGDDAPPVGATVGEPSEQPAPLPKAPEPAPPPPEIVQVRPGPPSPPPPGKPALTGEIKLKPRGIFIVNLGQNSGTILPGSVAYFAVTPPLAREQFYLSPSNTVLGFGISGLSFRGADISGGLDVTLRTPTPLVTTNTISPQFYDVHLQVETGTLRVIAGQYPDVLLPFVPDTTNSLPSGYLAGAIGFARPQLRADLRVPFRDAYQFIFKVSASAPIQTFDLGDGAVGRQGGVPDGQGRVSFAVGQSKLPWDRPFEIGVAGHVGRRRVTVLADGTTQAYTSWSIAGDLRLRLAFGMQIKARIWRGAVLGDYLVGIFQTVDLTTRLAVRATGGWIEVGQKLTAQWRVDVGYGRDDPDNADLGMNGRTLNQTYFGNVFWDVSKTIGFAVEVSRWQTDFLGVGVDTVYRGDLVFLLHF